MKIRYLSRALRQIDNALSYIQERLPTGACKVEERIQSILILLKSHPLIGTNTEIPGVRRIYLTPYPYLIDYYVTRDEIVVQRFRHKSRRPIA